MSKFEDNTKRRLNEMDEQSVTSIPPKKRFLSRASSPEEMNQSNNNEDATDSFKEPLEAFRKDAILRQWNDYLRSVKRWKKNVEQAEISKLESEDHLRLWEDSFKKLQVVLSESMPDFACTNSMDVDTANNMLQEDWANELAPIMFTAYKNKDYNDMTISKLNQCLEAWIMKRENIATGFESVLGNGSLKDYERILSSWANGQKSLLEMRRRCKLSNFKYLFLSEELRILNNRLVSTEANLRQAQFELEQVENKIVTKDEDIKLSANVQQPTHKSVPPVSTATTTTPLEGPSTTATGIYNNNQSDASADPLIHAQHLSEQRLGEIERIKQDRIDLKQHIARLEMDLVCVPEGRIYNANICYKLSSSRKYHKDKCNHLTKICHDLQDSVDSLSTNRRRLIRELDAEQINHFRELEEQLKKLDEDVTRIRGERDALQMSLELKKASSEYGRQSISELKVIADTRKERVNYLETEVLRLQKKMAARTGVKEYYDLLLNSDGREPLLLPLQNKLKMLEEKLDEKKSSLTSANLTELDKLSEWKLLEFDLNAFESKYGFHPSTSTDDLNVQKLLQDRIEKEKLIISESEEKIESLEAIERQLLSEIENVARAYGDLEDQNIEKVQQLSAIEDEVIKAQVTRVKYNQTFTALNKSKDAFGMVATSLAKQNEKSLSHIKQLQVREKNLQSQMSSLNNEYTTHEKTYDIYKKKCDEAKLTLDDLKEKTSFTKDKISELQSSIMDKIRLIEEGATSRCRLEESSSLLKRKLDSTNIVDRPAEAKLKKERDEYRLLLNCSKCKIRLKSHVIMNCMHTFCNICLEKEKKCPICNSSFNISDVRQFYF